MDALHPLCGIGVTSLIDNIPIPKLEIARIAVSLPEPGPLTFISTCFKPKSIAFFKAVKVAVCAAKGVLFLDPLNPHTPEDDQDITLPFRSVTETNARINEFNLTKKNNLYVKNY